MKLLVTVFDLNNVDQLLDCADGIIVGNHKFGTRLTNSFSVDELIFCIDKARAKQKEIFIQANQMFTDKHLELFKAFLQELPLDKLNGVVVADIGGVMVLEELGYSKLAVYNPETLHTNYFDFNYLSSESIKGAYVAKEITLEDIEMIGKKKQHDLFMVGHGHLNMFYSKRYLIQNYADFTQIENVFVEKQTLRIKERTRKDQVYPLFSDLAGTHVFRSKVFQTLNVLDKLEEIVDYLVIDTIFKDDSYGLSILDMYQHKVYNLERVQQIQATYEEQWDDGFLYFKTFYKKGDM